MPVFACLITAELKRELDGVLTGIGFSGVKHVFASHQVEAKRKSVAKLTNELERWEGVADVRAVAERVEEAPLWAMRSKEAFFTWRLDDPDREKRKLEAVREAQKFHRYIS